MDIRHLNTFVNVVRLGSFAAAARHLDMAPSMATRAVAALEAELGVRLLQRTTRKLALTEAGTAYYEQVHRVLEGLDRANDDARSTSVKVEGAVRLTTSVSFGQTVVVPLLPALHALHPALQIDVLLTDAVVDVVAERIDVALRLGPPADSSLIGVRLRPVDYRVCASPAYLATHGRPRVPADLSRCDCLRFPLPGFRTQWIFRDRSAGPATPRPAHTAQQMVDVQGWLVLSSALALHRAALDGLGPVLLADWLVSDDLASGRLIDLFPRHEATASNFDSAVWLLYASRAHVPRRVRAVVDFFRMHIGTAVDRTAGARAA